MCTTHLVAVAITTLFITSASAGEVRIRHLVFDNPNYQEIEPPMDADGYEIIGDGDIPVCLGEDPVCYMQNTWEAARQALFDYQSADAYIVIEGELSDWVADNSFQYVDVMIQVERAQRFSFEPLDKSAVENSTVAAAQ